MSILERLAPEQFGIFADSEALGHLNQMDEHLDPKGEYYELTRPCEGCSQMKTCYITWSELYCLQYGMEPNSVGKAIGREDLFPTRWVYDAQHQVFHPNYHCTCMGNPLVMYNLSPTEAKRKLESAGQNGAISDAQNNIMRVIGPVIARMKNPQAAAQYMQQGYPQGRR
jgi:hypothetical protein